MYHGGQLLLPAVRTGEVSTASSHPRWNQWLKFNIRVKNLPKVCVYVCVHVCVCVCVCVCMHARYSVTGCKAAHPRDWSRDEGEEKRNEDRQTAHRYQPL